ncbi:hypothetical protein D051_3995 [Vibrio parahaemolyticus VPCR-2010]|nr:hypothetical protein D051_3995 [Vibrio parahaemolyticus VPCR-2010]
MWSVLYSIGNLLRFFGKSALFVSASFEQLPQLSFWIERGYSVWCKIALEVLLSL